MDKSKTLEEVITFIPGGLIFHLAHQTFTTKDLHIWISPSFFGPLPNCHYQPNWRNQLMQSLKQYMSSSQKCKEADKKFTVFPHHLSKYGTLYNIPKQSMTPIALQLKLAIG